MPVKSEITLNEAITLIGKRIHGDAWKEPSWKNIYQPTDGQDAGDVDGEANLNGEQIVNLLHHKLFQGTLIAYVRLNNLKYEVPTVAWRGLSGIQLLEIGAISKNHAKSHPMLKPGVVYLKARDIQDAFFDESFDEAEEIKLQPGKAGRRPEIPYGEITAILWAMIDEYEIPSTQERMCTDLLQTYHTVFPKRKVPSRNSVLNEILRPFYQQRMQVKKILRKRGF